MPSSRKAIPLALSAILAWSSVAVAFKIGLRYFHFSHFLLISIAVAWVVFCMFLTIQKKWKLVFSISRNQLIWAIAGGILNPFLYYLILFKAYSLLPAQMAQSLNYTWPIVLVLLSIPVLGQKLKVKNFAVLFVGFAGVYLIASQGQPWPLKPASPFGVCLAVGSSVIWASYWLINTRSKIDPVINLFYNFLTAGLLIIPAIFIVPFHFSIPYQGWMAAIYAGCFEMGITFILWLMAMKNAQRTDQIANFVFLSPFVSMIFIYFILKEEIYFTTIFGLGLIVSSILLNQYLMRQKKPRQEPGRAI